MNQTIMESIENLLSGYKTHIAVAGVIGYVVGGKIGWWEADPQITMALGAAALAFLRMGLNKIQKSVDNGDGSGTEG